MRRKAPKYRLLTTAILMLCTIIATAQELQVKININTQQVERMDKSVFENLQQTLEQWMNDRQWTELQFQKHERLSLTHRTPPHYITTRMVTSISSLHNLTNLTTTTKLLIIS